MNKKLSALIFLLPLAILGAMLPGLVIPRAHADGSGLVCIAQVTDTNCPVAIVGPTFNGPLTIPYSLLRVPIMINNTDPFVGFDITLNSSDITKLKPYGADLTGSVMPSGTITLAECVGGVLIGGSSCASTDNPATVHLAVIALGFLSPPGATGLLFTAIFSITGSTLPGGVSINYQDGCTGTSSGNLCVTITNGTTTPVTEGTRTGSFDNSDTTLLPYATLSTPTIDLGQSLAGAPTHALPTVTFTATAQNGFDTTSPATLDLAASVNGTGTRPTLTLSTSSVDLTGVPSQTFTQSGSVTSTVPAGVFIATVTGTYQTTDMVTFTTSSLSAAYSLQVNVTDYIINASPNPVTIQPAGSQPVTITITPKAQFNTLVKLGLTVPSAIASAGIGATLSSFTISGGSGTSTLTVTTTTSTPAGTYTLTITSNSTLNGFTKIHTVTLTIKAGGFTMSATSPSSQAVGVYATSTITIAYLNGFTGTIALTNNTVANLSCQAMSPLSVTTNGSATISCTSDVIGTYTLSIIGTSGPVVRSTTATFTVTAGFSISATSPASQKIGNAETSTITVTYIDGFTGTITLTDDNPTNLLCQPIIAPSFTTSGTTTISCESLIAGTYILTITATSGPFSVSTTATFTFTIQTHDVAIANPSISPTSPVTVGAKITVTVQLQNKGPADENVSVSLLISGTLTVATTNVLLPGNSNKNVTLTWDTSTYAADKYTLTVKIQLPPGETNTESNSQVLSQDIGTSTLQPVTPPPSIDPLTLAIIAGVVIAAAAGSLLIVRRRRTPSDISQTGVQ